MTCESCGAAADVQLSDQSAWCFACHGAALRLRYDDDRGAVLARAKEGEE